MRTETRSSQLWIASGTVALIVFVLVIGVGTRHALAAVCDAPTKTWDGGGGDDLWSNKFNWSGDNLPVSTDDVCISGASVRLVSTTGSVRSIELTPTTDLTVAIGAALTLGAAESSVDAGATLSVAGTIGNNGGSTLNNAGTISITGNATVNSAVHNLASMVSAAPTTATLAGGFTDDGTLEVLSGTLRITGPTTSNGSTQVDSGATLSLEASSITYTSTASITGAGQMKVAGSSVTFDSGVTYGLDAFQVSIGQLTLTDAYTVAKVTQTGGAITGPGDLTATGAFIWSGGSESGNGNGTGTTTVASGATGAITLSASGVTLSRPLVINTTAGTITGNGTMTTGGSNGKITVNGELDVSGNPTGNPTFNMPVNVSSGATLKTAATTASTGTVSVAAALNNDGTVEVQSGTLKLSATGSSTGAMQLDTNTLLSLEGGSITFTTNGAKHASITGAGQMKVAGSSVTFDSGVTYGLDAFQVSIGQLTLTDAYTVAKVTQTGGAITGPGDLTATGAFIWSGGSESGNGNGTGTTTVASGATGAITLSASGVTLSRPLVINTTAGTITGNGTMTTGGSNGKITVNGELDVSGNPTGNPTFNMPVNVSSGATLKTAATTASTGTVSVAAALNNDGTVEVQSGTLKLSATGSSTGAMQLDTNTLLSLEGGSITFTTNGAKHASITGAGQMKVAGSSVTFDSGVTYGLDAFQVSIGQLTLTDAYTVAKVTQTGGAITGPGDLTATGAFIWSGGSESGNGNGTGTTTVASGATGAITLSASGVTLSRPLVINTTAGTITGNGTMTTGGSNGKITVNGELDVSGNPTGNPTFNMPVNVSSGATLKTAATTASTGTVSVAAALNNDGTVEVQSGTLKLSATGSSTGAMQLDTNTLLSLEGGSITFTTNGAKHASITGAGQMKVAGSSVTFDSGVTYGLDAFQVSIGQLTLTDAYTVAKVTQTGGAITGPGDLTATGAFIWSGGSESGNGNGTGTTTVASGATGAITLSASGVTLSRPLVINTTAGTITGNGTMTTGGSNGKITVNGELDVSGNPTFNMPISVAPSGILTKSGSGSAVVSGGLTNNGVLTVGAGMLSVGAFSNYNQATDVLSGGTFNVSGTLRFTGADIVTNQSTIVLNGSAALVQDTAGNDGFRDFTTNPGSLTVTGGKTLTLPKALTSTGTLVVGSGSTLGAPSVTLNGGTLSGTGTVSAPVSNPGGTVSPGFSPGALAITGSYSQGAGGSLPIEIGGTTAGTGYDQLNVGGAATLNGTLTLSTLNPFVPAAGQTFTILTYASHTGCFSTINGRDLSAFDPAMFYDVDCGPSAATVTVKRPEVSIDDVTVTEGDSGTTQATFTVSVSTQRPDASLSVDFATTDGTAVAPDDYASTSGTITWSPGDGTSKTVTVDVTGDALDEFDETFSVGLSNPTRVAIVDGSGTGTITDDDPPPTASIDDVTMAEGDSGTTPATFTVSLSGPSGKPISVDYATSDGTAVAPDDYTAAADTLTFDPGQTSAQVQVDVAGDTVDEFNEVFGLDLSNPSNVVIADGSATGTISDDDPRPTVSIDDVTVIEGDSGSTQAAFTVGLSAPSGKPISVDYATSDGTAKAPADYASAADTLSFAPGQTSKQISVDVAGDVLDEADETFGVDLSNPSNVAIADGSGTGTITDDDQPPTVSIDDVSVAEGNSGTTQATFTVGLSAPSGRPITVDYATADGTATAPDDYSAASGTLTLAPGDTSKHVTVNVNGDTTVEPDETFTVALSGSTNATITDGSGTGTIRNDDAAQVSLSIDDRSQVEGDSSTAPMTFTVSLSTPSTKTVTVHYATANGTAVAGSDYVAKSGTLTFAVGVTTRPVSVSIKGDLVDEADEAFTVNLTQPVNAQIADGSGTGTIVDDDPKVPVITGFGAASAVQGGTVTIKGTHLTGVTQVTFAKAGGGTVDAVTFTVVSDTRITATVPPLATTGRVSVTNAAGSATSPADLLIKPVILSFSPGSGPVGTVVTITGTGFTGATQVTFRGLNAPVFTVDSDTQITVRVPNKGKTGKIAVITPGGKGTSAASFTVL